MSTASEGTPTVSASRTGHPPSAIALLTATALGSVFASRLPKAPLVLAAGATALALLNQKKHIAFSPAAPAPRPAAPPPVEPPQALTPPQEKIQQWLKQQALRETEAEVVELPPPSTPPAPPEENYTPPAFLLDEEVGASSSSHLHFASLTEPVPIQKAPSPLPAIATHEPDLAALQSLEATESCPTAGSGWLLGIDPLPSIGEPPAPPVFTAPVFEGSVFPDEIEMSAPPEPVVQFTPFAPAPTAAAELPALEVPPVQDEVEVPVEQIPVLIALPGEASFDPPPIQEPHNRWQPPPAAMNAISTVVIPAHPTPPGPVIDAEIVLRPRAPTQNSVIAKNRPHTARLAPVNVAASLTTDATVELNATHSLPPAPQVTPREQRARPTWRSWWRGD